MTKKRWLIAGAALLTIAIGSALGAFLYWMLWWPYVYSGVSVDGIGVGGMTREVLRQAVTEWAEDRQGRSLRLLYGDTEMVLTPAAIGYTVDIEQTVQQAWSKGRGDGFVRRVKILYQLRQTGADIPVVTTLNGDTLSLMLADWSQRINVPAQNASFSLASGKVLAEKKGRTVSTDQTGKELIEAIRAKRNAVTLSVVTVEPKITAADIERLGTTELLSVFSTEFNATEANRTDNIRLASVKINGTLLKPGETFSFNEVVGAREKVCGFKEALEIVNGELVPGIGGGVCQVSSTLYNAVLHANLTILERTNHSRPLAYVALGRDATVVYNALDFKFINTSSMPVMVVAEVEGSQLRIGLFGRKSNTRVEIITTETKALTPGVIKREDPTLYVGEVQEVKQGLPGYEVTTVKILKTDGREISRQVISRDKYLPQDAVLRVGIKKPEFATQPPISAKLPGEAGVGPLPDGQAKPKE